MCPFFFLLRPSDHFFFRKKKKKGFLPRKHLVVWSKRQKQSLRNSSVRARAVEIFLRDLKVDPATVKSFRKSLCFKTFKRSFCEPHLGNHGLFGVVSMFFLGPFQLQNLNLARKWFEESIFRSPILQRSFQRQKQLGIPSTSSFASMYTGFQGRSEKNFCSAWFLVV